ncbi:bifunctional riboflavin kinase/FAD synthetase [Kineosporia sp. J2-2]|uniref:Riboflavin biosynthesis protein n=1 Tax=Kineosporia corallincola TaxID=2835133 RepID=A0ABS5TSX1_9ACTN|nr:bifunctional riboflavin kinase/FAD synthetase [Kineosporia corallincola]
MHVWRDLGEVPSGFGPSAVTVGNFDGVHRGHLAVLSRTVEAARRQNLKAVAITFAPHPLAVLHPDRAPQPLSTPAHRLELLADTGLDAVLMLPFTAELAEWSPRRFVQEVMVDALHAREVVVGSDTRFGRRNAGDIDTLRELGADLHFTVDEVADLKGPDTGEGARRWSSTLVREQIVAGDVAAAADVLGRPHRVTGVVVHGDHRGRELGFPTANLTTDAIGAVPTDGVYAGWLVRPGETGEPGACSKHDTGERLPAAISVGTNPTFDGEQRRVEAYVLGRDDLDLYGERIAVEFVERLRPTLRFDGIEALIKQMNDDVARCREVLGVNTPA